MTKKGREGGERPAIHIVGQGLKETNRSRVFQGGSSGEPMRNLHPGQSPFHEGDQLRIRNTDHHILRREPPSELPKDRGRGIGLVPGPLDHPDVRIGDGDRGPQPSLGEDAAKAIEAVPDLLRRVDEGSDGSGPGPPPFPGPHAGSSTTPTIQISPGEESRPSSFAARRSRSRSRRPDAFRISR